MLIALFVGVTSYATDPFLTCIMLVLVMHVLLMERKESSYVLERRLGGSQLPGFCSDFFLIRYFSFCFRNKSAFNANLPYRILLSMHDCHFVLGFWVHEVENQEPNQLSAGGDGGPHF